MLKPASASVMLSRVVAVGGGVFVLVIVSEAANSRYRTEV